MLIKSDTHHLDALLAYLEREYFYEAPERLAISVQAGETRLIMAQRYLKLILILWCTLLAPFSVQASLFPSIASSNTFVPVDQAFAFDFQQKSGQLLLSWEIKPGYYLYKQQFKFVADKASLGAFNLPNGKEHHDEFFGTVEIFTRQLTLDIPLIEAQKEASIAVTYQGCAEAGFCYPPETRIVPISEFSGISNNSTPATEPTQKSAEAESSWFSLSALPQSASWTPLWGLLMGLLVSITPCVLPMYPLISSLILGSERPKSTVRVLLLAFVYVQGMALAYTILGFVVASAGMQFQAMFQHPYVLIGLSLLFILLSLSMFGLYSLQLPSSLQTRLASLSNSQKSGSLAGVFVMGAIAGLICSPCTTAPLSAILLYISQSGSAVTGGLTLYLYALGMGIPLVIIAICGNSLLPRSGPWMQYVKEGFGFVILALPVFLLERIVGDIWGLRLWSLLAVAFFAWGFSLSLRSTKGWVRVLQLLLLAAALISSRPLQEWAFGPSNTQQQTIAHLPFQKISSIDDLHQAQANAKGKAIMLDLYADWCVACKEFEKYTFSDPDVQQKLANAVLLQADVTKMNDADKTLLNTLQVNGLPTILFFDAEGKELTQQRVSGFLKAPAFLQHLQNVIP